MDAPTKICTGCGINLNGQKRVKDPSGKYYCHPCWQARSSQARSKQPIAEPIQEAAASEVPQASVPTAAIVSGEKPLVPGKSENPLKIKLGLLAAGLGAITFFDVWPIIQISNHAPEITISYKGMFVGWWALAFGIMAMLPERIGFVWKRTKGQPPITLREKILFWVAAAIGVGMAVLMGLYISNQGYTVKF